MRTELLIERDAELGDLDANLAAARAGDGSVVVIEGPAGIGKTSLLKEAGRRAAAEGMAILSAQGAVLEHDFGFGAVRQLFEPVVARLSESERDQVLAGAAGLARPVVTPDIAAAALPSQQPALLHGLYWLTANLAERAPLLIVVDDVHWCDPPSTQYLAYLARRLEGLPIALLLAVRTGDPRVDPSVLDELLATPGLRSIRPAALSEHGVAQLISARLGDPDHRFVDACRVATGGVPFLLTELIRALHADGVSPSGQNSGRVAETAPRTVAHATMLRLSRLPSAATSVARAIAVLGRQARLDRVAALAATDMHEARAAVDALAGMELLAPDPPLQFSHPLVGQAVYEDMSQPARAEAHRCVAELLAAEEAPVDEIAAHLLLSDPSGNPDVVTTLRSAAEQMLATGAPLSAVAYLRRALAEGATHGDHRAVLLHQLGSAEAFARDPRAVEDLQEALDITGDPVARAQVGWELAQVLVLSGDWGQAEAILRSALDDLGDLDPDLLARIEGWRLASEVSDPAMARALDARLGHLRAIIDRGGSGSRMLALILAALGAFSAVDVGDVRALIDHGLAGGALLRDEGSESLALVQAITALVGLDDLDAAEKASAGVFDDASQRGSVMGYACGCYYRIMIDAQRGQLQTAESYLRSMVEQALEHRILFAIPSGVWAGTDVLLERTGVDDIAALVDSLELDPALLATVAGAWILTVRGQLRIGRGRRLEGIADLRAAGEIFDGGRMSNPIPARWRSPLALALPLEAREEARALVADELGAARARGLARCEGAALRAAGILEGGAAGLELLEESLRVLQGAGAPLEEARTLVELGAALRRANQRTAAREPLTAGLELAHVCGAERLAARAMEELQASGARPRRQRVSGPDSLTSAEARVARMAADGMTNKQIAQALFVTAKTVENQLGVVYRKLNVRSRDQLSRALSPELGSRP